MFSFVVVVVYLFRRVYSLTNTKHDIERAERERVNEKKNSSSLLLIIGIKSSFMNKNK
jgi:hypothetical protein